MLAKAVAHHTTAAFIRVVGSEFVQVRISVCCLDLCFFRLLGVKAVLRTGWVRRTTGQKKF
jgi:hypothetical protein